MSNTTHEATYAVAKINQIDLLVIDNGQKMVPIKPICDILGVDAKAQRNRIERDPILSSTGVMTTSVGGDGKDREMLCLPLKFVFGWLFTINPDRVSPDAREAVLRYKLECYNVLYRHFADYHDFFEYRSRLMEEKVKVLTQVREQFKQAKERISEAKRELQEVLDLTYQQYRESSAQMQIPFNEEGGEL